MANASLSATVTVHCLWDGQFMVVVSRAATLPVLDLGSVNMLEGHSGGSCGPVSASSAFVVFQFPVSACGTTVRVSNCICECRDKQHSAESVKLPFFPSFVFRWKGTMWSMLTGCPPHMKWGLVLWAPSQGIVFTSKWCCGVV